MANIQIPNSIFAIVYWEVKRVLTKDNPNTNQNDFSILLHKKLEETSIGFNGITYTNKPKYCYGKFILNNSPRLNFNAFFLLMVILAKENDIQINEDNFKEGFKSVFDLYNGRVFKIIKPIGQNEYTITDEQIKEIESKYKNYSFSQSEEKKHTLYRCYYYFSEENDTVSFFTKINFKDEYAVTVGTQSGHDFSGDIWTTTISVGTSLLLKNVHEENKRVLHVLLSDGQKDFPDRELSIGLFLNINPVMQPEGGVIIFQKIGENLTQKETNDFIDKYKTKSVPEAIRFYLEKKEYRMVDNDVITLKSLKQRLNNTYPHWPNLKKITERITGIFKCFTINREGNIDTHYFLFKDDGSFKCKTNDVFDYSGCIKIESSGSLLLSMQAGKHHSYYKIFINLPQRFNDEKIKILPAIYAGIAVDNQPKGGRCFFVRMTDIELNEMCLQKENSEHSFDSNSKEYKSSVKLNDDQNEIIFKSLNTVGEKDISELESQNIELINFLSGIDNQLIEDGSKLLIENIRFPNSKHKLLSDLSGVYDYYRTSGYKENAFVKKYPLRIDAKGKVTVYGNTPSIGQGLVYNDYLFIHLFNTEKHETYTSPNHNLKKYDGVAVFKINERKLNKPMLGVYQSFNAKNMMVVGRIILTRSKTDIVGEPDSYQIRTSKFDLLDTETNGIASFLVGQANNLISYSRENWHEIKQEKSLSKTLDLGLHLFDSACWKATNKDNDDALRALNQAILNGFNDKERFSEELEGAFKHIKSEVIDLWDSHIPF